MVIYSKIKEKDIIPILAWCCWKVCNLMVFEGVIGSVREARIMVMRFASAIIQCQASKIKEEAGDILKLLDQGRILESPIGKFLT